jgi:hypothetical protein
VLQRWFQRPSKFQLQLLLLRATADVTPASVLRTLVAWAVAVVQLWTRDVDVVPLAQVVAAEADADQSEAFWDAFVASSAVAADAVAE